MVPHQLRDIIQAREAKSYSKDQLFHSLDFTEDLYVIKSGYVKRYAINANYDKAIESIYGPNHFFPLTPVFMNLFGLDLGQSTHTYVYQAMTDIELNSINSEELLSILKGNPVLYADLLYETGRRLKVDVNRLTSNALKNDHKKIVHQLFCLAEEFGELEHNNAKVSVKMPLPLAPLDFAQQVNCTEEVAANTLKTLEKQSLIVISDGLINIPDLALLKDEYLR